MADDADDPAGRALALLSCLSSRQQWTGHELAHRLRVTPRTVRRDVDRLRRLGYQIDSASGTDGGYRLRGGVVPPPVFLDQDEAIAVVTALMTSARDQASGMERAALGALAKLHLVLPTPIHGAADAVRRTARTARPTPTSNVEPRVLARLAECCRDRVAIRFDYLDRGGEASQRRAEPHTLVTALGVWYLVAYDLGRADWRTFRVDRIAGDVEATGHSVAARDVPHGDPVAYLGRSLAAIPYDHHVELDVAVGAPALQAAVGWLNPARVTARGQRACTVRLGARRLPELARQVVEVVAAGRVTELRAPAAVTDHLAGLADVLGGLSRRAPVRSRRR